MNKKFITYLVLGTILLGTIATLSASLVVAQGGSEIQTGDQWQGQQDGNGEQYYRFQMQTRIRVNASHNIRNLSMNCDGLGIGDRTFSIDVETEQEFNMSMNCVRDQDQLGIQNGSTIRNQHRHQVRNNFAVQIECSEENLHARLGMEMTRGDALRASWAYFDEDTDEWVEVESSYEDGMLVAETDHFSVWTIVEGGSLTGLWIGIGVGVVAIAALAAILIRKKRA